MKQILGISVAILVASSPARADDSSSPKDYLPPSLHFPQVGFGYVVRGANEMDLSKNAFDFTVRWSPSWRIKESRVRAGGFIEARSPSFDHVEYGVGPQAIINLTEWWSV